MCLTKENGLIFSHLTMLPGHTIAARWLLTLSLTFAVQKERKKKGSNKIENKSFLQHPTGFRLHFRSQKVSRGHPRLQGTLGNEVVHPVAFCFPKQ